MKKLPYKNLFVVLQINNSIKKIFFDEVVDYKNYSDVNFDEHKTCMAQVAVVDDKSAEELFVLLCQTYVNTKSVIKEFKAIAKSKCFLSSEMTVTLIFDLHINADDSGTVEIHTWAHDENRDAFNEIAKFASNETMKNFVESLSIKQQDLLFEFV